MTSWPQNAPYPYPPIGTIVTISWVDFYIRFNSVVIDLIEYPAPETGTLKRGWEWDLFKPVQSTETGMSILRKLLLPTKQLENV